MRPRMPMNCEVCGKEFQAFINQVKQGRGRLCSYKCCAYKTNSVRKSLTGDNNPNWKGGISRTFGTIKGSYIARYPERHKAHQQVRVARRMGILRQQPCEQCGLDNTVAHHTNYERPLQVFWLCHKCHHAEHKRLRSQGIGVYAARE